MNDPATGPIPREEFKELASAPHGHAAKRIRAKYDPLFGLAPGEKIEWKVTFEAEIEGVAYVMAASEKEAEKLAGNLSSAQIEWDEPCDYDIEQGKVEPVRPSVPVLPPARTDCGS